MPPRLLCGVSNNLLRTFQYVQHATATTGTRGCERIIPNQSCRSCTGLLFVDELNSSSHASVHQSLAGQTHAYLASDIQLIADTGRTQLQSASEKMCVVPRTYNSFSGRSFSAAGPLVWNALPTYLRQKTNCRHCKQSLKVHMFRLQTTTMLCDCCFRAPQKHTYLLTYLLIFIRLTVFLWQPMLLSCNVWI